MSNKRSHHKKSRQWRYGADWLVEKSLVTRVQLPRGNTGTEHMEVLGHEKTQRPARHRGTQDSWTQEKTQVRTKLLGHTGATKNTAAKKILHSH